MKADSLSVPRHQEEESLSIYPYTYQQMWFQGSVDCPSPAARGGETNDVPAWAPISQLFPLFRSETLKWSVDSIGPFHTRSVTVDPKQQSMLKIDCKCLKA